MAGLNAYKSILDVGRWRRNDHPPARTQEHEGGPAQRNANHHPSYANAIRGRRPWQCVMLNAIAKPDGDGTKTAGSCSVASSGLLPVAGPNNPKRDLFPS